MLSDEKIKEILRIKPGGSLYHRESKELEFKEQFNYAGLPDYFRDFAAFSNSGGGYLVFGITNSPRKPIGLNAKAIEQFESIDPERITGGLLDVFSPSIDWEQKVYEDEKNRKFGIFYIAESKQKPVIAKKDEGRDQVIKNGEIYFRYGGRTQRIQFAELRHIIDKRIIEQNDYWANLMSKIAKIGPNNAAVLDTEKGLIEKNDSNVLVIDKELIKKIRFVKQGSFTEKSGETVLRLVGDVRPINSVEVVKIKELNLIEKYPIAARQLVKEVKARVPRVKETRIYQSIKDNLLRQNRDYSAYNFRNKVHE